MRKYILLAASAILLFAAAGAVPTRAGTTRAADVGLDYFYNELAPYGEWVTLNPWGWVWCPYDVAPGWRPYTDGDWLETDDGWTFDSTVPWGWAVYHYGRWGFDDNCGWYWVPDNVWGPAWVAWRHGGGYMGWAPLPPGIRWGGALGLELGGFDLDLGIGWPWWSFCEVGRFGERHLDRYLLGVGRNMDLLRDTRNVTNYGFVGGRIVNNNIAIDQLERESGRHFERYALRDLAEDSRDHIARLRGNELDVFRPRVLSRTTNALPNNVLPLRRLQVSPDELSRRQTLERNRLDELYRNNREAITKLHQNESARSGTARAEVNRRHDEQVRALEQRRQVESHVLENRHARETQQHRAAGGGAAGRRK